VPKIEPRNYARVFETFGVESSVNGSAEARANACPWCGKDKFFLNVTTGLFDCKHCEAGHGNVNQYLTWVHAGFLARTRLANYQALKARRSVAIQRLKAHQLAYAEDLSCDCSPEVRPPVRVPFP
jgi:hypothetical protein